MVDIAKHLQIGQTVRLEMVGSVYQITPVLDQAGLAVLAVGADYVVLGDDENGVRTRIPSHFLKFAEVAPVEVIPEAA